MNQIIEVINEIIFHARYASGLFTVLNYSRFRQILDNSLQALYNLYTCTLRNYFKLIYRNEPRFHTSGLIFAPSMLSYLCLLRHAASGENRFRSHTVLSSRMTQT